MICPLIDPSVNDDGNKVMYLKTAANGNNRVQIKDLNTNEIVNELVGFNIGHTHMNASGTYFAYDGVGNRIWTREIGTGEQARVAGGNWKYGGASGWYNFSFEQ